MRLPPILILMSSLVLAQGQPSRSDTLHQFSASLVQLSARVNLAVVQINSTGYALDDESESGNAAVLSRQRATGAGVVLTADGYIITNNHVVQGGRRIRVQLPAPREDRSGPLKRSGRVVDARVVGVDRVADLAVLKIEAKGLPFLALGDSSTLKEGQVVLAFGAPMGLRNSVSMGVVSAVARQLKVDDPMIYVQTDAPINPGNSGGPLVDVDGRVMGINTFIFSQSGGSEGIGFAIPSNIVHSIFDQIRTSGHVHRGETGILAQTITPALAAGLSLPRDWGVMVGDVMPDGPAAQAGVKIGDIILAVDGRPMENAREFLVDLFRHPVGQKIALEVLRDGDRLSITVPLIEREDDPLRFADYVDPDKSMVAKLGILGVSIDRKLADMLPDLRIPYGVIVAARGGQPSYTGGGLEPGDVIHSINNAPVTSVETLRAAFDGAKPDQPMVLQVEREGQLMFVALEPE